MKSSHAGVGGNISTCPMHPEVQAQRPGKRPTSRMDPGPKDDTAMGHTAMDHTEHEDHSGMVRGMREKWLWTNFAVISLGVWLISSPFTFGYASRGMIWSDVASGLLFIFFSAFALWLRFDFVGCWCV